ncbi:GNAT family N-acetyltransferase [Pseudorhodobacter sp. E13]|uniref:GNAT family N-acetyltransferase n=1 Tax=Pseudorhodobacter sp. E13 TaxID=2487931 RepID=UPI000F8ED8A5|nr:GNAT family N-acetyltransferase [Pseudorhodobacter sp. E13]RUS58818.1 GNAT family N-acetyltransferase [Pseudorhodobacter sp. E13]
MTPDWFYTALEQTWPAASLRRAGPWLIREGRGGGQRVSAATAEDAVTDADIPQAEAAMQALGQAPLFMLRDSDTGLDALLAARGYRKHDPVVAYAAPTTTLATPAPSAMAAFPIWPPLSIATQLWADAGIGPGRIAVMERVQGPKTVLLGRVNDRASGVAFVACHGETAMLHALEVVPSQRRQGSANNIMRMAAVWAQDHGATRLCLAVTEANTTARALYASLGMEVVGTYHYRKK